MSLNFFHSYGSELSEVERLVKENELLTTVALEKDRMICSLSEQLTILEEQQLSMSSRSSISRSDFDYSDREMYKVGMGESNFFPFKYVSLHHLQ